jgi:pantothenate kinase
MNDTYPFLIPLLKKYARSESPHRFLVGIVGPPASGKSFLAELLAGKINEQIGENIATYFNMDGYHLFNSELHRRGIHPHKGCIFTFDVEKFTEKLVEIKESPAEVFCSIYDRSLHDPTPDGHLIGAQHRVVFVEGNYLLSRVFPWTGLRFMFDYSIFLEVDPEIQFQRLLERHISSGKSPAEAENKAIRTDLPNSALIRRDKDRADFVFWPQANRQKEPHSSK